MNGVLDYGLVSLALAASAGYALLSLGPRSLRRRLLEFSVRLAARAPRFLGIGPRLERSAQASLVKTQGACGGCQDCGSAAPPLPDPSGHETRVPVARIGRRTPSGPR